MNEGITRFLARLERLWQWLRRHVRSLQALAAIAVVGGGILSFYNYFFTNGGMDQVGDERIGLVVSGFNDAEGTKRLVIVHNHGNGAGTLVADIVIIVYDAGGDEVERHTTILNPGLGAGVSPFTLPENEGRRYFLPLVRLSDKAQSCTMEFKVMQGEGGPRQGHSQPFPCSK
ncbi:MAG: hypothetical protein OXI80_20100 [Caldilineaceae bacterium]|nr:hypothetical protein [Defluviicoccus sp.]MDE0339987.1 hypothetical protein [Caldilineaceae bacterium]